MKNKIDKLLYAVQLYSYLFLPYQVGNKIMDFREKHTIRRKDK